MIDDVDLDNRPMLVLPRSHTGPIYDHRAEDGFAAPSTLAGPTSISRVRWRASVVREPLPFTTRGLSMVPWPTVRHDRDDSCCTNTALPMHGPGTVTVT
jgi:hypothetical protein